MPWYEGETRAKRVGAALRRNGFDALLAVTPENAAYLSGQTSLIASLWRVPGLAAVAVGQNGRLAVAAGDAEVASYPPDRFDRFPFQLWIEHLDLREVDGADLAARIRAVRPGIAHRPAQFDLGEAFAAVARAVRAVASTGRRIGADLATLSTASHERLRLGLAGPELVDATVVFDDLRAIKDDDEVAALRLAAELTEVGIAAARDALRPGLSRIGVMAAYQTAIWRHAAADARFAALRDVEGIVGVGDGPSAASLVGPGQTVKLDMQVEVGGYHSDVGRTYVLAPTDDQRAVYAALQAALADAEAAVRPGTAFSEVFAAGVGAMRTAGFANYSRGHLGHSVGLAPNYEEPPFIAPAENRPLAPGMVISLELPYSLVGIGGFQLERMLLVTPDGSEPLDRLPFALEVNPG